MNNAIGDLLSELLKDSSAKEKLSALTEKSCNNIQGADVTAEDKCSKLEQKIQLLNSLCPIFGENFTFKAQKVIRALKAIKTIYEMEQSE